MTARVTLACDGRIGGAAGYDCRQATPVGTPRDGAEARRTAARVHGWSTRWDPATWPAPSALQDLCPACTRRTQEATR